MGMSHDLIRLTQDLAETRAVMPVIDMHLHFVDFMQRSDLFENPKYPKGLIPSMDEGNIAKNVIFGLPVKKKWEYFEPKEPAYYLSDNSRAIYYNATDELVAHSYQQLPEEKRRRIAPTLVGFDPTDLSSIEYVEYMFGKYPFWRGVGEVLLRHDDLTNLTIGETARANHPAMDPIYDFCGGRGLPVCLHQNSTSVASSISSTGSDGYVYLHELTEVLDRHPDTTFIWAHCGISRRVEHAAYHQMVCDKLREHKNLYVDLSWVVYENMVCEPRENKSAPLIPKQVWIDEVIMPAANQDRVMIGSDLCGHFSTEQNPATHAKTMARYNPLLLALQQRDPAVAQKVAAGTADRLYFQGE
jgi:hypothetical protein